MQQHLSSLFEPRLKQTHPYQKVLSKSCADLRLLPHLIKSLSKIELVDSNQKLVRPDSGSVPHFSTPYVLVQLFSYSRTDPSSTNFWRLVTDISLALGEEKSEIEDLIARASEAASSSVSSASSKPGAQIKEFMRLAENEGARVVQLLKCLHPEIRGIGARKLKSALTASGFNVRETGDQWNCTIQLLPNEILVNHSSRTPGWNIPHRETSRSSSSSDLEVGVLSNLSSLTFVVDPKPEQTFEIHWNVCLAFSMSLRRFECKMSVLDFKFEGKRSEIADFKKCISPWVSTEVQFYRLLCKDARDYQVAHTLPKLVGCTTVLSHSEPIFYGSIDDFASYRILSVLAKYLEPELVPKIEGARKVFKTRAKRTSPDNLPSTLRECLSEFFLLDLPFESSPVGRLLRSLDRQMLGLAMSMLRETMAAANVEFVPTEKWSIIIRISATKVRVWHFREEILRLTDLAAAECNFTWRLELCFNRMVTEIQSSTIEVVDWEFKQGLLQETKQSLLDIMSPLVPSYIPYERALKTPIKQCNIGSDLLYVTKHMEIRGGDDRVLFRPESVPDTARSISIRNCYGAIFSHLLDEPARSACITKLSASLEAKSDPTAGLELFCRTVLEEKILAEDSDVMKLFRLMSQLAVTPAVNNLRKDYHSQFPYRAVKGSWKIALRFSLDRSKILVRHTREEQSTTDDPEGFFTFQWQVQLTMSLRSQKLDVKFQINSLEFQEQTSYTTRAQLLAAFKDLAGKNKNISTDSNAVPLEAIDCVRLLLQTLRTVSHPPRITRPDLRGMSSITLLEGLEKALVQQSDKSFKVMIQPMVGGSRRMASSGSDDRNTPRSSPSHRKSLNAHRVSLTTASPRSASLQPTRTEVQPSPRTPRKLMLSSPRKSDMIGTLPSPRSAPDIHMSSSAPSATSLTN